MKFKPEAVMGNIWTVMGLACFDKDFYKKLLFSSQVDDPSDLDEFNKQVFCAKEAPGPDLDPELLLDSVQKALVEYGFHLTRFEVAELVLTLRFPRVRASIQNIEEYWDDCDL